MTRLWPVLSVAPPTLSQCTLEPLSLAEAAWLQRKLSPVCIFTAWLSGTWHLSLSTGLQKCYWVLARPMLVWPGTCPWSGRTVASELPLLILPSPSTVRQAITEARCQGKELQTCTQRQLWLPGVPVPNEELTGAQAPGPTEAPTALVWESVWLPVNVPASLSSEAGAFPRQLTQDTRLPPSRAP